MESRGVEETRGVEFSPEAIANALRMTLLGWMGPDVEVSGVETRHSTRDDPSSEAQLTLSQVRHEVRHILLVSYSTAGP